MQDADLDALRTHYLDFYNLSPVGFCSISEQGLIIETNHTTAAFMGSPIAVCITRQQVSVWIDANQAELDMFGFTREEILGRKG